MTWKDYCQYLVNKMFVWETAFMPLIVRCKSNILERLYAKEATNWNKSTIVFPPNIVGKTSFHESFLWSYVRAMKVILVRIIVKRRRKPLSETLSNMVLHNFPAFLVPVPPVRWDAVFSCSSCLRYVMWMSNSPSFLSSCVQEVSVIWF